MREKDDNCFGWEGEGGFGKNAVIGTIFRHNHYLFQIPLWYEERESWTIGMPELKTYAVYKNGTLILDDPLNLPDHTRVEVVIRKRFSEFVRKFGEPEAKEDIDQLLLKTRRRVRDA
ncbi:MAG TPA: antitoxin family protein [Methanolinea sp.]|nr:antitoxin family protein [Methanolinea sp.]